MLFQKVKKSPSQLLPKKVRGMPIAEICSFEPTGCIVCHRERMHLTPKSFFSHFWQTCIFLAQTSCATPIMMMALSVSQAKLSTGLRNDVNQVVNRSTRHCFTSAPLNLFKGLFGFKQGTLTLTIKND